MAKESVIILIIYLSVIGLGVISSASLQWRLKKSIKKLPTGWRESVSFKKFQQSILFLMIYLLINFISECIAIYLAGQHIYNSFVMSINSSLSTLFLFGFFFINSQTSWKRYAYVLLYIVLLGYFITGGYYHPRSNLTGNSALIMYTIYFLGALIHLTDLLTNPKSDHFKFRLKINLSILICILLADIINPFLWFDMDLNVSYSKLIFYIHISNFILFYFSFALIFINESLKLRRG